MPDLVASQVIQDGTRNYIAKFTNVTDGSGESAVRKITVSTLAKNPDGRACSQLVLQKVDGYSDGMGVDILWDATTPLLCIAIPKNDFYTMDYTLQGGLPNNAGAGKTGDVLFNTRPATTTTAGSTYSVVLQFSKVY